MPTDTTSPAIPASVNENPRVTPISPISPPMSDPKIPRPISVRMPIRLISTRLGASVPPGGAPPTAGVSQSPIQLFSTSPPTAEPIAIPPTRHNRRYLATKRDKLGHLLDLKLGET